jgi:hypothetical protein
MDFHVWRAITWPLLGCVFWWAVGRGIEALLAVKRRLVSPRISWFEAIAGAASLIFFAMAAVAFSALRPAEDDLLFTPLFVTGFVMWALLGGILLAARVAQWRMQRQLNGLPQRTPAP